MKDELIDNADNPDAMISSDNDEEEFIDTTYFNLDDEFKTHLISYIGSELKEEMLFMLETGLNLLIYGVGSKINFIKWFTHWLKGHPMWIVNGYHPGTTLKGTLKEITTYINTHYVK